jgi:Domain of Unknown Function (DUF1080)
MKLSNLFQLLFSLLFFTHLHAQHAVALNDLSFFHTPGPSWKLAGDVHADLSQQSLLNFSQGTGILVNISDEKNRGKDLYSVAQFGDMDLELDYMMATGSNSGIYLQGRYEIQLLDSWGVIRPTSGDNGGIYERWDDKKAAGQQGYDGHAPRQNASRAPGLWQHIKISFQAPRFNENGGEIQRAKVIRVELNGVTIQEDVELSGPTRGSMENNEVARGPLRLQGDHGSVAFRNIVITPYDSQRPVFANLMVSVYKGKFEREPDYKNIKPESETKATSISLNLNSIPEVFLMRFTGIIRVASAGEYDFEMSTAGGTGSVKVADKYVIPFGRSTQSGKVFIPAGDIPFELIYSKQSDWDKAALGFAIRGPGIRKYVVSDVSGDPVDPILIEAPDNTILRSFVEIDTVKLTHTVNVGSPLQVNYTYDLDKGTIVQLWHGGFLDATEMFRGRGEGLSRPLGMVLSFGIPSTTIQRLTSIDTPWLIDTSGTNYRPKGYVLDMNDRPTFRYLIYNEQVSDKSVVLPDGHGIRREISIQQPSQDLYVRAAFGSNIEKISEGLYLVGDKSYYLKFDDLTGLKPVIRVSNGQQELIIPLHEKLSFTILF